MKQGKNLVILVGVTGADGELRTTQGGTTILKLRLAVPERYKDKDDAWKEKTEWVNVVMFGKRADAISKFITKGQTLYVQGKINTNSYEKDGEKRYSTSIVAEDIILLGGGKGKPSSDDDGDAAPESGGRSRSSGGGGGGRSGGGGGGGYSRKGDDDGGGRSQSRGGGGSGKAASPPDDNGGDYADYDSDIPF